MTGEGEDGGVVYCEMQGTENTGETKTHLQMIRCLGIPAAFLGHYPMRECS
jgi:hypothetical protein